MNSQTDAFFSNSLVPSSNQYQGRRPELTGGGLIRSAGGWEEVKRMREAKEFQKSDERILGDGDFVEEVLGACNEKMERRYRLKARGYCRNTLSAGYSARVRKK
jgi:putative transposase